MSNYTLSTNMSLPIPTVGVDEGPDYADNINACLTLLDIHTHSAGSGVAITPSGLNINATLTFANNALTNAQYLGMFLQTSNPSTLGALYYKGVDLYFNDGSGNHIQMTTSGGVAGTPGAIGSLVSPAAATYSLGSTKFVWTADTNKYAAMDSGELFIRETNVASPNYVNVKSPSSLAANYTLTLPTALPGSTQYLACSSAGALSTVSADAIGQAMTSTGSNAISVSRTRSSSQSVGTGGVAISTTSTGLFSTTGTSFTAVTNASVTIITSGRPVVIGLMSDGVAGLYSNIAVQRAAGTTVGLFKILRGATVIGLYQLLSDTGSTLNTSYVPSSSIKMIDAVTAGTYTYTIQIAGSQSDTTVAVEYAKLFAYEL